MPSDQRLHPASLVFAFGRSVRAFAVPGLIAAFGLGRASVPWSPDVGPDVPDTWQIWLMLLIVPSVAAALARYLSFRLRYEDAELVIRSGILFRNERHVPYHRIQNLDAVQNVVHRALRVIEVRIDTGASEEPEATISVLPEAAFADMRRRVFAGRLATADAASPAAAAVEETGQTLLRLPVRELLLCGFLENRGLVVVATLYGVLWEVGILAPLWNRVFDGGAYAPGMVRNMMRTIAAGSRLPLAEIALVAGGIVVLLLLVRGLSMLWAVVRLYGFRLSRVGDDVRTEFGLMTRISATIPIRRVQSITIREPLLYRAFARARVRVDTAGGSAQPGAQQKRPQREPLAPIIGAADVPALIAHIMPEVDATRFDWQPPHPRAFRRAVKPALVLALLLSLGAAAVVQWRAVIAAPVIAAWLVYVTYRQVQHLAWAATDDVVAFRSGWLGRSLTIVPVARIQAVRHIETPFDRRTNMGRVRVDTAGANPTSHRVDIPYLPRDVAFGLHHRLAAGAAASAFRW